MSIQTSFVTVNGQQLHYAAAGSGPLIVFLHGFPDFWWIWRKQLLAFAPTHRAIAPDMRGYNLSAKPAGVENYALPSLVVDIADLIDQLGGGKAIVVGHDWGGVVAWALAHAHPERVRGLCIVNAPHPDLFQRELAVNPAQQAASTYITHFRQPGFERVLLADDCAMLKAIVITPGLQHGYLDLADSDAYLAAWQQPGAIGSALKYYRAALYEPGMAAPSAPPRRIDVPTLVLWGEGDSALLTSNLDGLSAAVPNLCIERIADATHALPHEQPERITQSLRRFIP
jgi:epoxide hydrolase 4